MFLGVPGSTATAGTRGTRAGTHERRWNAGPAGARWTGWRRAESGLRYRIAGSGEVVIELESGRAMMAESSRLVYRRGEVDWSLAASGRGVVGRWLNRAERPLPANGPHAAQPGSGRETAPRVSVDRSSSGRSGSTAPRQRGEAGVAVWSYRAPPLLVGPNDAARFRASVSSLSSDRLLMNDRLRSRWPALPWGRESPVRRSRRLDRLHHGALALVEFVR